MKNNFSLLLGRNIMKKNHKMLQFKKGI